MKIDEQKKVLSKFTILGWATFIATLDRMQPVGRRVGPPAKSEWWMQ